MGIEEYSDYYAKDLSGGTQRKLSMAMAIINDPTVCLLDEVSTGMDPASRRALWTVIRGTLSNRASILTTHSMEEAEALCTRIGIVVKGRLKCIGSPQHLKSRFGEGYTLEVKVPRDRVTAVELFVMRELPGAKLSEAFGGHLVFNVSITENDLSHVSFGAGESKVFYETHT